jgi:hypothetical protein
VSEGTAGVLAKIVSMLCFGLFLGLLVYVTVARCRDKDHWLKRFWRWGRDVIDLLMGL